MKLILFNFLLLLSINAQSQLVNRGNGLIYDSTLDITWLSDANYAATSGYDDDGYMNWYDAVNWVAQLEYEGYSNWRLPNFDVNNDGYIVDCEYQSESVCTDSEVGYMYYYNLSGVFGQNLTGVQSYFTNIQSGIWSSNTFDNVFGYYFEFARGKTSVATTYSSATAWAVADGDIASVPVPTSFLLFSSGFLGFIGIAKKKDRYKYV